MLFELGNKLLHYPTTQFSIAARLKSFTYAGEGIIFMLRTQQNAWLHLIASMLIIAAGLFLGINSDDWIRLIFAMCIVWASEAMNTAFEHLCDVACPTRNVAVKRAKDVAAGSVLICATAAAMIGVLTLIPYVLWAKKNLALQATN